MSNWSIEPYDPSVDDAPEGDCGLPDDDLDAAETEDGDDDG